MNEILDEGLPLHPLTKQQETVRDWRQIGLGVMGVADMLIKLGVRYGSLRAQEICDQIGFVIADQALASSAFLAEVDGTYPKYNKEIIASDFLLDNTTDDTTKIIAKYGLRNSQLLTIAPTGTLSTMLGISGGMEPIFANSYTRKTESLHGKDTYYKVYTPIVEEYMWETGITDEKDLPDYFVTAADLTPLERIKMQGVFQRHIDASISSTVNLPKEATIEDVEEIYMQAWKHGLKGITIYRAGCAREGILVEEKPAEKVIPQQDEEVSCNSCNGCSDLPRGYVMDVSDDLIGYKRKLNTGCGSLHFEVYSDEMTGEPQETFINIGSSGGCERNYQFISRLISMALRGGIPIEAIIDQAMSIRPCKAYTDRTKKKGDTSPGTSCPSAFGHALKDLQAKMKDRCFADESTDEENDGEDLGVINTIETIVTPKCPECGEPITFEGGCNICKACGWSKCD